MIRHSVEGHRARDSKANACWPYVLSRCRGIVIIIIIIERKDLGGVMSKRLQGHLTNAKNSFKTRVRRNVRTEMLFLVQSVDDVLPIVDAGEWRHEQ